jgi:hypothetical protein
MCTLRKRPVPWASSNSLRSLVPIAGIAWRSRIGTGPIRPGCYSTTFISLTISLASTRGFQSMRSDMP